MDSIIENYKDSTSSANSLELVLVLRDFSILQIDLENSSSKVL